MVFKSAISKLNQYVLGFVFLVLIGTSIPVFWSTNANDLYIVLLINGITIAFLAWIYLNTYYTINQNFINYKSGPFSGKIDILKIKKIEMHNGIFVPTIWKPALSHIGLIITYNNYDDIYISPEKEELFLKTLLAINPNIKIIPLTKK